MHPPPLFSLFIVSINYSHFEFQRTESTRSYITLIGEGKGVTKTITVAEIIKRKVERIYQYNEIGNVDEDGKSGMYMKIYLSLTPVKELEMALGCV